MGNRYFQEIYPKLLGGGAAKIELGNSVKTSRYRCRVWANPPGKKMKILSLLSGGEKSSGCDCSVIFFISY